MKRMLVVGLCALALGLVFITPLEAATKKSTHRAMPPKDRISADSAKAVALAKVPDGHVKSHELEYEGGKWVYSYDISVPGKPGVEEVQVDAKTGEVVSQKHESTASERREEMKEHAAAKKPPVTNKAAADTTHH